MPATPTPVLNTFRLVQVGAIYQATNAVICGNVTLGADCSVWFGAVIRGDVAPITLGDRVNVQEHVMIHCDSGEPLTIEERVTIGHGAVVHGERVGAGSLIGIKAVVLGHCVIGKDCLIAAGAVLSPRTVVPDGHVAMGVPAKVVRPLKESERAYLKWNNEHYVELAREHVAFPERFYRVEK